MMTLEKTLRVPESGQVSFTLPEMWTGTDARVVFWALDTHPNVRKEAFERLMTFKREKLPENFDYRQELMEAFDERYGGFA